MIKKNDVFDKSNLELAFFRLKYGSRHLHKQLYRSALNDIEPFKFKYLNYIQEKYSVAQHVDRHDVFRTYLPKKGGFVRPIIYLGFESLLIYQAIANKLIEDTHGDISKNYNNITFGNHFNENFTSKFTFKPWKENWRNYQEQTNVYINKLNFNYVVDFDIASFYDSIDHKLLITVLKNHLDEELLKLLKSILNLSFSDFNHIKENCSSGIPQGPQASTVLSEIFLHYFIDIYFSKAMHSNEIIYVRYADDIRVFARENLIAKKFVTILDLLCRNSGLIPQSAKVGVNFYSHARELINQDFSKFSRIQKTYKKTGKLKAKDHRKALNMLKEMLRKGDINKTKLSFYIYKLEKDDELKDLILTKITDRYEFCDQMLVYLKIHYSGDPTVIGKLVEIFLVSDSFFLDYPVYSFLEKFHRTLEFNSDIFLQLFAREKAGKWLSKIALLKWAVFWKKKEIVNSLNANSINNILLKRELLCAQLKLTDEVAIKKVKEESMFAINHPDMTFRAIAMTYWRLLFLPPADYSQPDLKNNPLADKIFNNVNLNPLSDLLTKQELITVDTSKLFTKEVFSDENEFDQLSMLGQFLINYYEDNNYKLFIDSLDQFNHVMVERLFCLENGKRPEENYGSLLKNDSFLSKSMAGVRDVLLEIHLIRNGELHPKDIKTGKFYSKNEAYKKKQDTMSKLYLEWLDAINNIVSWQTKKF